MKCSINVLRGRWYVVRAFVFVSLITYHVPLLYACPLCKEALTQGMAKGFFWSILLMLAVPALVVGVFVSVLWRAQSKKRGLPDAPHE